MLKFLPSTADATLLLTARSSARLLVTSGSTSAPATSTVKAGNGSSSLFVTSAIIKQRLLRIFKSHFELCYKKEMSGLLFLGTKNSRHGFIKAS
jgi:hypothetical protein